MVELINGEPPFMGESQNDQLVEIIKVLGTPSKEAILAMNKQYDVRQYNFPNIKAKEWKKVVFWSKLDFEIQNRSIVSRPHNGNNGILSSG